MFEKHVIFFGASLSFAIALAQLPSIHRPRQQVTFGFFFCLAYLQHHTGLFFTRELLNMPQFMFTPLPCLFFMPAFGLLYSRAISNKIFVLHRYSLLHLVPGILSIIILITYWTMSETEKIEMLSYLMETWKVYPDGVVSEYDAKQGFLFPMEIMWLDVLANTSLVLYCIKIILENRFNPVGRVFYKSARFYMILWAATGIAVGGVNYVGLYLNEFILIDYLLIGLGVWFMLFYVIGQLVPHLIKSELDVQAIHEKLDQKYTKSRINNLNLAVVSKKVDYLMDEERIYTDENLSLQTMAQAIGIQPHQLSEYLNEKRKTNFANFVNRYRVEEAKRLLIENENLPVIFVGLEAGFKTNSSFYGVFGKEVGMSPGKYRRLVGQ